MCVEVGSKKNVSKSAAAQYCGRFTLTTWGMLLFFLQSTKMNELHEMKQIVSPIGNGFSNISSIQKHLNVIFKTNWGVF